MADASEFLEEIPTEQEIIEHVIKLIFLLRPIIKQRTG